MLTPSKKTATVHYNYRMQYQNYQVQGPHQAKPRLGSLSKYDLPTGTTCATKVIRRWIYPRPLSPPCFNITAAVAVK